MKDIRTLVLSLWTSEDGGTMIEYCLVAALIALTVAKGMGTFETKHLTKEFNTINSDFKKDVK
ncbi:MAG: Flp family type IVb pilin [Acidobacteriaceae bacterium]